MEIWRDERLKSLGGFWCLTGDKYQEIRQRRGGQTNALIESSWINSKRKTACSFRISIDIALRHALSDIFIGVFIANRTLEVSSSQKAFIYMHLHTFLIICPFSSSDVLLLFPFPLSLMGITFTMATAMAARLSLFFLRPSNTRRGGGRYKCSSLKMSLLFDGIVARRSSRPLPVPPALPLKLKKSFWGRASVSTGHANYVMLEGPSGKE